ncbi:MAG: rhodanese-like domain-containing protein [Candidatus Wallbacteria bacterium]|nr:rhodanese-like domain-containing protein [Candidatus Wallbacteria bacterium]
MKFTVCLFLLAITFSVSALDTVENFYLGQLVYNLKLNCLDLEKQKVESLFETELHAIPGQESGIELTSQDGKVNYCCKVTGGIVVVDNAKKILKGSFYVRYKGSDNFSTQFSLFAYRGETKKIELYKTGLKIYQLEIYTTFNCYECPSPWDSRLDTENTGEAVPISLKISESKNGAIREISQQKVFAGEREKGNFQVNDSTGDLTFELEARRLGEAVDLKLTLWMVNEEKKTRTTFNDEARLILLPDEPRKTAFGVGKGITLELEISMIKEAFFSGTAGEKFKNISAKDAADMITANKDKPEFVILDVRTGKEFSDGHLEKAVNLDYYAADFSERLATLDHARTYLVYCKKGARSGEAARIMQGLGFKNVINITDGYTGWVDNKLQTVK